MLYTEEQIEEGYNKFISSDLVTILHLLSNTNEDFVKTTSLPEADFKGSYEIRIPHRDIIIMFDIRGRLKGFINDRIKPSKAKFVNA